MVKMTVLYNKAADSAAFHKHYSETHVPLAKRIPGLREYTISSGVPNGPDGKPAPYELVANLTFESQDAFRAAARTPEFAAAGADLSVLAPAGVTLLVYEERPA